LDTLLIFEDEKGALAPKACELLARDRRLVPIPAGAPDTALSVAIDASDAGVAILARGTTAAAALAFAAHADDRISALVLESPPDAGSNAVLASLLPQTALPTLVIYGTEDRSTPADCGRRYKALLPNSWFIMVYRAGPDIAGDRPEGFADLVGDFLKRGARFTLSERSARLNP
jgi:pimeloyl-ACP methyl ester carboxylesterase